MESVQTAAAGLLPGQYARQINWRQTHRPHSAFTNRRVVARQRGRLGCQAQHYFCEIKIVGLRGAQLKLR